MSGREALLSIKNLKKWFPVRGDRKAHIKAVDDITLDIRRGETLGIVGESGCGKTTLGRVMIRLSEPTEGSVIFEGTDISHLDEARLRPMRKDMQIIFQDPYGCLDPRMTVGDIIGEPFVFQRMHTRSERNEKVRELMGLCGLDPLYVRRYPHEFSGGQRQRIGIARALALNPKFLLCDEPVSALDMSIQSQIINLLRDLQEKSGLTYAFISHNLSVVHHMSDRIAVMYLGNLVELAERDELYRRCAHPYTRALLASIPTINAAGGAPLKSPLAGDIPSPVNPPAGCVFHTRCPHAQPRCGEEKPALRELGPEHFAACLRAEELG